MPNKHPGWLSYTRFFFLLSKYLYNLMLNATPPWPMTLKNSLQIVCKHIKYYLGIRTIVSICWYGMNFSFRRQCSLGDNSKWVQTLVWYVNFLLNDHTLNCLLESDGKKVHFLGVLPKAQVSGLRLQHKGEMGDKDFLHLLLIFLPYLRIFQSSAANLVCSTLNTVESCVLFSDQTYLGPIT